MNNEFECLPFIGEYTDENGWDIWFKDCKMTKDFGDLKTNDTFDSVYVSFDCSEIRFFNTIDGKSTKIASYDFDIVLKPK
jgi:hypothetical protein